jgi:hypothetical protein
MPVCAILGGAWVCGFGGMCLPGIRHVRDTISNSGTNCAPVRGLKDLLHSAHVTA